MSLADHVRVRSDPELELAIELKYGSPRSTIEYVDSLPITVVKRMNHVVLGNDGGARGDREEVLRDNVRVFIYTPSLAERLKKELFLYHSLLGRV